MRWTELLLLLSVPPANGSTHSSNELSSGEGSGKYDTLLSQGNSDNSFLASNMSGVFTYILGGLLPSTVYQVAVVAIGNTGERSDLSAVAMAATSTPGQWVEGHACYTWRHASMTKL